MVEAFDLAVALWLVRFRGRVPDAENPSRVLVGVAGKWRTVIIRMPSTRRA